MCLEVLWDSVEGCVRGTDSERVRRPKHHSHFDCPRLQTIFAYVQRTRVEHCPEEYSQMAGRELTRRDQLDSQWGWGWEYEVDNSHGGGWIGVQVREGV